MNEIFGIIITRLTLIRQLYWQIITPKTNKWEKKLSHLHCEGNSMTCTSNFEFIMSTWWYFWSRISHAIANTNKITAFFLFACNWFISFVYCVITFNNGMIVLRGSTANNSLSWYKYFIWLTAASVRIREICLWEQILIDRLTKIPSRLNRVWKILFRLRL